MEVLVETLRTERLVLIDEVLVVQIPSTLIAGETTQMEVLVLEGDEGLGDLLFASVAFDQLETLVAVFAVVMELLLHEPVFQRGLTDLALEVFRVGSSAVGVLEEKVAFNFFPALYTLGHYPELILYI